MAKDQRFVKVYSHGGGFSGPSTYILVDTKTGVNYLYVSGGYGGGLSPLLDQTGKPIISTLPIQTKD